MTQAPKQHSQWIAHAEVPAPLVSARFVLEPLAEQHVESDFAALMSCRARLREELQWGFWPPDDFTLEANRADLQRHHDEFLRGEAFAYTVLSSDRIRCLGCIYLERCCALDGAQLAFWMIDGALDWEEVLVTEVLEWVHSTWLIERIVIPLRESNTRGIALATKLGFPLWETSKVHRLSSHHCYLSQRSCGGVS